MVVLVEQLLQPGDATGALLELLAPPAWHADAACREHPELEWLPGRGADVTRQVAVCAACLVRGDCLDAGVAGREAGVWGGLGPRARRRAAPPRPVSAWHADGVTGGAFLRAARERAGLTQATVAAELGVSVRSIMRWEAGRTAPRADDLEVLLDVLGVDPVEVLAAVG